MFESVLNFWKGKDFLTQALEDFEAMLTDSEAMFIAVLKRILGENMNSVLKDKIYEIDRRVNETQRNIRKRIIEHFALQPKVDVSVSLVLMSVVKDAERLGDYAKNLFEVSELLDKPFDKKSFRELFDDMDKTILTVFRKTKECFVASDAETAGEITEFEREVIRNCDNGIEKLAKSKVDTNKAICATLIFRYFKRICCHLGNIASSVIMPISDLDYFDEKRRHDRI